MKKVLLTLMIIILITTFIPIRNIGTASETSTGLQVHFLDVGQGDCAIVLCDREAMVIDGRPRAASQYVYTYIREALQLTHIDYIVSTHPHIDHVGGLATVLNAAPVDLILTPALEWDSKAFSSMIEYADIQGTVVEIEIPNAGDTLQLGSATVTILHCWPEAIDYGRTNDASIVLCIDYGKTSFLFTGDAEDWAEYMMIDSGVNLNANVKENITWYS